MSFDSKVKEKAFIACKRYCVLCEQFKSTKMECHHIVPKYNGGEDTFDNCIPLCFDCHQEIGAYNSKHKKGNKYSVSELKQRRNEFYQKITDGKFPINTNIENYIPKECDIELAKKIKEVFKAPDLQYYLKDYDLGGSFKKEIFYPLNELEYQFQSPEYEFVDDKVEECKKQLEYNISKFTSFKAANTFGENYGYQGLSDKIDWNSRNQLTDEFNELATNVWKSYCDLVKIIRVRF